MSVKIALLGFGTVASGVPFLLKENHEKITQAAQDEIEIAKVLVRDDAEKEKLQAAGHNYNFVTNVDEIIEEVGIPKEIMEKVEEGGTIAGKGAEGDVRGSFSKYADLTERAINVKKQIIRKLERNVVIKDGQGGLFAYRNS